MSKPRNRSEAGALLQQLGTLLGPDVTLQSAREREWASATFAGCRHQLIYAVDTAMCDGALGRMVAALPEHEFALPNAIVADCTATLGGSHSGAGGGRLLLVELLTIGSD